MLATPEPIVMDRPVTPQTNELPDEITLEVNRFDIRLGIRNSGNHCPIAVALKRKLGEMGMLPLTVDVERGYVGIMVPGVLACSSRWRNFFHNGREFVERFDKNESVQPCTVVLRKMRPS